MNGRSTFVAASLALVLALAALLGLVGTLLVRPAAAQGAAGVQDMRQITVIGLGEVRGAPDIAQVQLGVETRGATAGEALVQNSDQMAQLIATLQAQGVAADDIQTISFNVSTDYDYDARTVRGYVVANTVAVTIRDLAKAGDLLDAAVQSGANTIYGISFSRADSKALQAEARAQAIADARERATQMASAAGVTLGELLVVSESIGAAPVPMPMSAGMAQDSKALPVQPGSQSFSAQVQVTFALR